jgi:hypothetical protein
MKSLLQIPCFAAMLLIGLSFGIVVQANGQCTNTFAYGSATINPNGAVVTTAPSCAFAGDYSTINGAVAGQTLRFTSSISTDFITIRSGTPGGLVLASGQTPLVFTNTFTGTIYGHWNTDANCGTANDVCRTVTVQCTSCLVPGECDNTQANGSATIDTSGAVVTITTCAYAGQYSTISGAVAGQTLRFTSSIGTDFITIRSGTPGGAVLASGQTPLVFSNTFTGTIYAHWNTDANCGSQQSCRTVTVQCTFCLVPPVECTNTFAFGSATINPSGAVVTIAPSCAFAGDYSTINGAVAGQTLRFTSSIGTDFITIRSGTPGGAALASGQTPLVFSNTFTGTIFAHWNTDASCGTADVCRTVTVQCTSCLPPCTNTFAYGSATINPNGAVVTIIAPSCIIAGDYSTISGAEAGQTLRFTSSIGTDFITIRSGTPGGPVLASGQTPLVFSNTFTGTIYAHWNTDASCGVQNFCRTVTVQCIVCSLLPPTTTCAQAIAVGVGTHNTGPINSGNGASNICTFPISGNATHARWYTFTPALTGEYTIGSAGLTTVDTRLSIHTGSCGDLACYASSDDVGGGSFASQVTECFTADTTYYIEWDNRWSTSSFNWSIAFNGIGECGDDGGLPEPWACNGIGSGDGTTLCSYDNGQFTINTGAANNSLNGDNLGLIEQFLCGDFTITARVVSVSANSWAGLTVREDGSMGSRMVAEYSNLGSVVRWESRMMPNMNKVVNLFQRPFPYWLRLVRQGNTFIGYYSTNGVNFSIVNIQSVPMNSCVTVAMAAFSNIPGQPATVVFSNVAVTGGQINIAELPGNEVIQAPVERNISLFPNPARDIVTIDLGAELGFGQTAVLRLRNDLGQLLEERRIDAQAIRTEMNVSRLIPGIYFIEVHTEGTQPQMLRFVKSE